MNKYSTVDIPNLENLFSDKRSSIRGDIGNLQINDVREDAQFQNTVNRIVNYTQLEKVTIGQPVIVSHTQSIKDVPPNYNNVFGGQQKVYKVIVSFPVTGSRELFRYRTSGSLAMRAVYVPSNSNITIEVQTVILDKVKVLNEASEEISTTRQLIEQNNAHVDHWNKSIEEDVKQQLDDKRRELIAFYS